MVLPTGYMGPTYLQDNLPCSSGKGLEPFNAVLIMYHPILSYFSSAASFSVAHEIHGSSSSSNDGPTHLRPEENEKIL